MAAWTKYWMLMFLILTPVGAVASDVSRQDIARASYGKSWGVELSTGRRCRLLIWDNPNVPGQYFLTFRRPGFVTSVSTSPEKDERWTLNVAEGSLRYTYAKRQIDVVFWFDERLQIVGYQNGTSNGERCQLH